MKIHTMCNGKATIVSIDGNDTLLSYGTEVCCMTAGVFKRTGYGYKTDSATTMRHVNEFRSIFGLDKITKGEWNAL